MGAPFPASVRRAAAMLGLLIVSALAGCADSSSPPSSVVTYANRVLDYSPEIPPGETLGA